jgi:hypothetical protein
VLIGISAGGCSIIEAEKNNRGGFLDQVADDIHIKADSKKMRALRAIAIEVSLARIAMITPKSAPDRALLARRIGDASKRGDVVRRCAFSEVVIAGQRPSEPCFFFDSVMVDYENALFDLAMIALPLEEAKTLITRVSGGIAAVSVNPLELVQALLDIGREAFRYGRVVGAIYRDTLELEVQVWLASPQFALGERAKGVPEELIVTNARVAGLRAVYARGNDDIPAWRAAIAALRAQGLEPVPDQRFIIELYSILVYVCGQIVSEKDDSYAQCAFKPSGTIQVAGTIGLGGNLVRVGTGIPPGRQDPPLQPRDPLAAFRATLCVTEETTLGPNTQKAVRLFKAAVNDKAVADVSDRLSTKERTLLQQASTKFTTCRRGMSTPPRNPFEVGLYSFNSADDVNGVLRDALAKAKVTKPDIYSPGPTEVLDLNRAVTALRDFYKISPPAGMQNAELDDQVWIKSRN